MLRQWKVPEVMWPRVILETFCREAASHQKLELPILDIVYGCMLAAETVSDYFQRIFYMEAVRRHLNYLMTQEAKGGDVFYSILRKLMWGHGSYTAHVNVLKGAGSVDGEFKAAVFREYEPMVNQWYIDEEMLKELGFVDFKVVGDKVWMYSALLQGLYAPWNERFEELVGKGLAVVDPEDKDGVERLYDYGYGMFDGKRREKYEADKNR